MNNIDKNKILKKYSEIYTQEELNELQKVKEFFDENKKEHEYHQQLWNNFLIKLKNNIHLPPSSEMGKVLAKQLCKIHQLVWQKAYKVYPKAEEINKAKHDEWVKAGLHEFLWGQGNYEWLLEAFKKHQISLP